MANSYFKFKQFTIHQDKCAMKVCTDACLFGALVAEEKLNDQSCLDIGTGTGLLSLMLAQKNKDIKIDAVEIEAPAAEQALANINASPWAANIQVHHIDILNFSTGMQGTVSKQYDCIISNPPFFEGDLKSGNQQKDAAKHDTTLTLEQLLQVINRHLSTTGFFAVLLPYHRLDYFIELALKAGYFLNQSLLVKHTDAHPFFRGMLLFSRAQSPIEKQELSIKNKSGNYTPEFVELMQPYYLHL